jgi:hypothetical protein
MAILFDTPLAIVNALGVVHGRQAPTIRRSVIPGEPRSGEASKGMTGQLSNSL